MKLHEEDFKECFSAIVVENTFFCREWRLGSCWNIVYCAGEFKMRDYRASYYCPRCGKHHDTKLGIYRGAPIPHRMTVRIFSRKNDVLLRVSGIAYKWESDRKRVHTYITFAEEFKFDFKTSRSTWRKGQNFTQLGDPIDFTNPFNIDLLSKHEEQSILTYLDSRTLVSLEKTKSILLAEVKKRIQGGKRKLSGKFAYSSNSADSGKILSFLKVMAYKIAFPDLPMPKKETYDFINAENAVYMERRIGFHKRNFLDTFIDQEESFEKAFKIAEQGKDSITSLVDGFGLPNKPAVRKAIRANPFDIGKIKMALSLFQNFDIAMQAYQKINVLKMGQVSGIEETLQILYGDSGILRILDDQPRYLMDTLSMIKELESENRENLLKEKPSLSELHDWLVKKIKVQEVKGYELNIPPEIRRRLEMQMDKIKFFLPKTSKEMAKAGNILNNCLSTYIHKVHLQETNVVFYANKNGKLKAVLRIENEKIREAKLVNNKSVRDDKVVNQQIIEWAEFVHLKISTNDIDTTPAEKTNVTELRREAG